MAELIVKSPFDQKILASLTLDTEAEAANKIARAYHNSGRAGHWPKEQRISFLQKVAAELQLRQEIFAEQIAREGGKPIRDARIEAARAVQGIEACYAGLYQWHGQEIPMGLTGSSSQRWAITKREPRGLVLAISAFNHPLNLLVHQIMPALAIGCPVLIKPSLKTPLTCQMFVELLEFCGLPESWVELLLTADSVTEKIVSDPRLAALSFIGAAEVGWSLRRKTAPGVHVLLEHGGTAPLILAEDADLDLAIPLILKAAYYHAGQVCVSLQNLFVHASLLNDCRQRLLSGLAQLKTGDPLDPNTDVGPLISIEARDRVVAWIEAAAATGATRLAGGQVLGAGCMSPALMESAPKHSQFYNDEIFGPALGIYPFERIDACLAEIRQSRFAFQAALFTEKLSLALHCIEQISASTIMINDHPAFRADWMPFGGHKASGLGSGGILPSMFELSQEKLVIFRSPMIDG